MPGFLGKIGHIKSAYNENLNRTLINDSTSINDLYIERRTVNKFINDKIFKQNDNFFILTEGIILNSKSLITKYGGRDLFDTIINMYLSQGDCFFKEFRGSFSGVLYDKKQDKKIIYTDHIGDKQVFFSHVEDVFLFGSEINFVINYLKQLNLKYTLNRDGAYYLLTYGYMLDDSTLFSEIKKLNAGHYILIENGVKEIKEYHRFNYAPIHMESEEEIIENIDLLFRQAVKRGFEKDLEYDYKHLAGLSGGLDSRMTTWVAHDMGYGENIVNFTFSQSDYLDETIPKKIASDLKHEWIFKSLDNGLFLKNIEKVVKLNAGSSLFYGLAHGKSCIDFINLEKFGIVHTGQAGNILKCSYNNIQNLEYGGWFSSKLISKINQVNLLKYKNEVEFRIYNRQFNGTLQGNLPIQERAETLSPFMDVDLIDYCMRLSNKYKENELFINWMVRKYPKSADYVWEGINRKVTDKTVRIMGREIPLKQLPQKTLNYFIRRLRFSNPSTINKNQMNPLDYWYHNNLDLRRFMDNYFETNILRLNFDNELKNDCQELYLNGSSFEKNQALTLLATLKLYFSE